MHNNIKTITFQQVHYTFITHTKPLTDDDNSTEPKGQTFLLITLRLILIEQHFPNNKETPL